jgi:hypothetical protein
MLLTSIGGAGAAAAGPVEGRYGIALAGLQIGTAVISGDVGPGGYRTNLNARLTGLVGVLTSGQGAVQVSGAFAGQRPLSSGYALSANNSQISRTIQIGMNAGNITQVAIDPPFEPKPDRVPVLEHHRRNVVDPVSALLMPVAGSGDLLSEQNCSRVIPVFDGVQRFDVTLSPAGSRVVNEPRKGYVGHALVCNARYAPVAGHRPIPATDFMRANRDMQVWLVPVAGSRTLVPWRIQVRTQIGNLMIEAQHISGLEVDATASIARRN